jgi:hypothetical protein
MTEQERDQMVGDAAYAAMAVFEEYGALMPEEELFALNDYLTALARRVCER